MTKSLERYEQHEPKRVARGNNRDTAEFRFEMLQEKEQKAAQEYKDALLRLEKQRIEYEEGRERRREEDRQERERRREQEREERREEAKLRREEAKLRREEAERREEHRQDAEAQRNLMLALVSALRGGSTNA